LKGNKKTAGKIPYGLNKVPLYLTSTFGVFPPQNQFCTGINHPHPLLLCKHVPRGLARSKIAAGVASLRRPGKALSAIKPHKILRKNGRAIFATLETEKAEKAIIST
jgi:hypothetical protein